MKLGVDALRLGGQRLGIGRYIEYLVKYWAKMAQTSDHIILYLRDPLGKHDLPLTEAFQLELVQPRLTGLLWQNLFLSRQAHVSGVDVLFGPSYTVPLTYRGRCVVATHSLNEAQSEAHSWWYHLTYAPLYRMSARKADCVIVPSQSTKNEVQVHYGIPADRIAVVPEGAPDSFRPIKDEALLRATREKYLGKDRPYILFVGKLSQRRNIPILMKAFAVVKKREKIPHSLLLFGPNHLGLPLEQLATDLGITDSFVQTDGRVANHDEVAAVYNAADLYVSSSSYEGFSLTVVEAMACGLPVIATRRAALAEIADGYALLVDDPAVEAFSDAIARVLGDRELQAELRAKSLERARVYRWENTARGTWEVLRQVAEK
jgi:glycosyltransferase involved in cell wall biosynthesis